MDFDWGAAWYLAQMVSGVVGSVVFVLLFGLAAGLAVDRWTSGVALSTIAVVFGWLSAAILVLAFWAGTGVLPVGK